MADANYPLNAYLPGEIPGNIVQYLTVPQLSLFKQLCKQFNWAGSQAVFLQPLYNRLYALDKTLSPILTSDNASLEFKEAFEKIRDRQNAEMGFFHKIASNPNHAITFSPKTINLLSSMQNVCNIEQLEKRSAFLNNLNMSIIHVSVNAQPGNILNLSSCITRFIIEEVHIAYFKNLTTLTCQNNLITTLNLEEHPNLKLLDCRNNPCLKEINLLGCSSKLDLKVDNYEKPINIFSDNYDFRNNAYTFLKDNLILLLQSPASAAFVVGTGMLKMGYELVKNNQKPLPPKINVDNIEEQDQKEKLLEIEEIRLFKKLKAATLPRKKTKIIQQLGEERYTLRNCLKYGCLYESSLIMRGTTSSMFEKTSNLLFSYWGAKKEEDSVMPEQESAKRKREDNDGEGEEPENNKKRKLD